MATSSNDERLLDGFRTWIAEAVHRRDKPRDAIVAALAEHIEDNLGERDEMVFEQMVGALDARVLAAAEDERSWHNTVNQRIDAAFAALTEVGIIALANAGYTLSDGWSDVHERAAATAGARGAVFYHGQDLERAVAGKGLMLAFGAPDPAGETRSVSEAQQADCAIAQEVCVVLKKHDIDSEWDGNAEQRIRIKPFAWQPLFWMHAPAPKPKRRKRKAKAKPKASAKTPNPGVVPELKPSAIATRHSRTPRSHGWLTRIEVDHGLSPLYTAAMHTTAETITLAANIYDATGGYDCCYLRLDNDGELGASLKEDLGLLPRMFTGPDGNTWALIVNPYGDRDRDIIVPLEGRDRLKEAKRLTVSNANPIGGGLLCKQDPKGKADKVMPIVFSKGIAKRGKALALELPAYNKFTVEADGLHGLVRSAGGVCLHRRFDDAGAVVDQRSLQYEQVSLYAPALPVKLSFTEPSFIVTADPGVLRLLTFDSDGTLAADERLALKEGADVYGINAVAEGAHTAVSFVGKTGGWAYARDGEWVEGLVAEDSNTWRDANSDDVVQLPEGEWVIPSIAINRSGYYVWLAASGKAKEMFLVGRRFG